MGAWGVLAGQGSTKVAMADLLGSQASAVALTLV